MIYHQTELHTAGFPARAIRAFVTMGAAAQGYKETFDKACLRLGTGAILGFLGKRGTGKTVMSAALANISIEKKRTVLYTTAHRMFMRFKDSYRRDSAISETDVYNEFRKPSLLVIDEIGKRQESDWENRTLIDLGDARYGDERDTILISNQEKKEFDAAIGDSMLSRMDECGGVMLFNWDSFRA